MNKKTILHIGLPKTATTLLQEMVFVNIKDVFYIGLPKINEIKDTPLIYINELNKITSKKNSMDKKEIATIKNQAKAYLEQVKSEIILFSNETLCGQITSFSNTQENAIFLKEIFENSKIVFTIRKQSDWAESIYNQIMTKHNKYIINEKFLGYRHGSSINKFFNYKNDEFAKNSAIYNLNWLSMAKDYIETFGKENVLVLPYELLKGNLNDFLNRFYEFTGLEPYFPEEIKNVNKRIDNKLIKYSPILSAYSELTQNLPNSWVKNFILKNDRGIKKFLLKNNLRELDISKELFTANQKEFIRDYYQESNKQLSELIGFDLEQYGYY